MPRALAVAVIAVLLGASALAQEPMKPSAPDKMMSPAERKKMRDCQKQASDQHIKMDERAKFVMDCMART